MLEWDEEPLPIIEGWLTSSVTPKKQKKGKKKRKEKKHKEPLGFYKREEKSDAR